MADDWAERAERSRAREWRAAAPVLLAAVGVYLLVVEGILVLFAVTVTPVVYVIIGGTGLVLLIGGLLWASRQSPARTRTLE